MFDSVVAVSDRDKQRALELVLQSRTFMRSEQLRAFLGYVCSREIEGRGEQITEYRIAVEALGRSQDYTTTEDSAVRNRAHALRVKLEELYTKELPDAPIRINFFKGSYRPHFVVQKSPDENGSVAPVITSAEMAKPQTVEPKLRVLGVFVAGLALAFLAGVWLRGFVKPTPDSPPKNYTFPGFATYTSVGEDYGANLKSTYEEHWNATLQKQLGRDFILSASYLGNRTLHMWAAVNANPTVYIPGTCGSGPCSTIANTNQRRYLNLLDPVNGAYYGPIYQTNDGANAWYNAMLLSVQRRFSQHYSFMANYTWSHCISEADTGGDLGQASAMVMNPSNVREDRGNCLSDRRQIFNSSIIAQTPEFASTLLRRVASGWQTSAIITAQAGNWSSVTTGSDTSLTASQAAASLQDRANVIGDWHGDGTRTNWFQRAAFVNNVPGVFGNVGRNSVLQPGAWNIDASLVRRVKVREGQSVEIRAEAFNLLNHANFGPTTTSISSGTFGKILTSGAPRICEFALKYVF